MFFYQEVNTLPGHVRYGDIVLSWKKGGNSMFHAPLTKHSKYDESEPLKCIDFINSTFKR
jgi:hypothetical protein